MFGSSASMCVPHHHCPTTLALHFSDAVTLRSMSDAIVNSLPALPPDLWRSILSHLRFADHLSPLACTCKLFLRSALSRLAARRIRAGTLRLSAELELTYSYVLPRVDRKRGSFLFVVNLGDQLSPGHDIEVWDIATRKKLACYSVPSQIAEYHPEEVTCSPDGIHVTVTYYKFVALFRFSSRKRSLTLLRGYELDEVDQAEAQLHHEMESVVCLTRFSPRGDRLAIAFLQAVIGNQTQISAAVINDAVSSLACPARTQQITLPLCPENDINRFYVPIEYDWDTLSLHGAQLIAEPLQLLIPPNRISDAGVVLTGIDRGAGAAALALDGFFDSQISGFSPDACTMVEARESALADTESSTTEILFHATCEDFPHNVAQTPYGTPYHSNAARALTLYPPGGMASAQFSADSSTLFIQHGTPTTPRSSSAAPAGWTVIRRSDGRVAAAIGGGHGGPASGARVSADGAVVYGRCAVSGKRAAWLTSGGARVWEAPMDSGAAEGNGAAEDSGEETVVVDGLDGFLEVRRAAEGQWRFRLFTEDLAGARVARRREMDGG